MKKMILILMILLVLPVSALAEKLVFVTTDWPPYAMLEQGQPAGMNVDIVKELCKRLGIEGEIQVLPWKRALRYVEKGEADAIFSARYTEERAKFMYYPSEHINDEKTIILARKGSGIKANSIEDLKGKSIGIVRGYAYGPELEKYQEMRKKVCDNDEQLVKIFANGLISLAAGMDEGSMRYLCKKAGIETEVVLVLDSTQSYIGFSKAKGEKGRIMGDKFSNALKQMREEGEIEKIQNKYF